MKNDTLDRPFEYMYFDCIDSTNTYLKKLGKDRVCVRAGEQYEGRGRMGKKWVSENNGALMFSVSFFEKDTARALLYPLMCALSVCRAGGNDFLIKWPNDIISEDKKIAGILCESILRDGEMLIVCGFGINISQSSKFFEKNGLENGGSIFTQTGECPDHDEVLDGVLKALDYYTKCNNTNEIVKEYNKLCLNIGKQVQIIDGEGTTTGLCIRVDFDGGLLVQTEKGLIKLQSGEVSVRGENGEYI